MLLVSFLLNPNSYLEIVLPIPFYCTDRENHILILYTTKILYITLTLTWTLILNLAPILTLKFKIGWVQADILSHASLQ